MNSMVRPSTPSHPPTAMASERIATSVNASASTQAPMNAPTRTTRRSRGISIAHLPQHLLELLDDRIHGIARHRFGIARGCGCVARTLDKGFELARKPVGIHFCERFPGVQVPDERRRIAGGNDGHDRASRGEVPVELAGHTRAPALFVRKQHEKRAGVFHGGDTLCVRHEAAIFDELAQLQRRNATFLRRIDGAVPVSYTHLTLPTSDLV